MCETSCTMFHTGRVNRNMARIKVVQLFQKGIDGPVVCHQCQERFCVDCPSNAMTIGDHGQIIISPTLCTLCGKCERNCPLGAIELFDKFVYVCDLCGGSPKCVEACTEGVITYFPESKKPSLAEFVNDGRKMNPSEKRLRYIEILGRAVRKEWRRER
ncbi:MAG: 4Fe-4S binding protein [Candidatus Heimdallarchaeota archaeon]|nr:MAG: 4Fe-4S binding protein [Candidatus Heimdallarchaeota archaeon]